MNAAAAISFELGVMHVLVTLVVILLPFIIGLLTVMANGFDVESFPLVISMVEFMPEHHYMRLNKVITNA